MRRQLGIWLSLSALSTSLLGSTVYPIVAVAQTPNVQPSPKQCYPQKELENRLIALLAEAWQSTEQGKPQDAIALLQQALPLAQRLNSPQQRANLVGIWNSVYSTEGRWQRLTDQAKAKGMATNYIAVLDRYTTLLESLNVGSSYLKTISFAEIATQYAALGQKQKALNTLEKSRQAAKTVQGAIFRAKSLVEVAKAAIASGQTASAKEELERALQFLQQVPKDQERYQYVPLASIVEAYAKIGDFVQAEKIATRLPKNPDLQSPARRAIALSYLQAKQLTQAEKVAQTIAKPSDRVSILGQLAVAYAKVDATKSKQLFDLALQTVPATEILAIEDLIYRYLEVGQIDTALQVARTRLQAPILSEVMKSIVIASGKAGQKEKAVQLLSQGWSQIMAQPEDGPQYASLDSLMALATQAQQFDWILQHRSQAPAFWRSDRAQLLPTVAAEYAKLKKWQQVEQWVDRAAAVDTPLSAIQMRAALVREASRANQNQWATQQFEKARQGVDRLAKPEEKVLGLGALALAYAESDRAEASLHVLAKAVTTAKQVPSSANPHPLETLFNQFRQAQQWTGAFQIAIATRSETHLAIVTPELIKLDRAGLVQQAIETMPTAAGKTQVLLGLAKQYWQIQRQDLALSVLEKALKLARTVPGEESIVDRLGSDGMTVIEKEDDRGSLITAVALEYALWGDSNRALQTANLLQDKATREAALQRIACQAKK